MNLEETSRRLVIRGNAGIRRKKSSHPWGGIKIKSEVKKNPPYHYLAQVGTYVNRKHGIECP